MPSGTTIAAVSTAPGSAPRAMIRISGDETLGICGRYLARTPEHRGASSTRFKLSDELDLPVMVLFYAAPSSYSGEDTAEILLPGGTGIVSRVLETLLDDPRVQLAGPGEFSARAYLHGHLTLAQAEGIALKIAAENEETLHSAEELLDGRCGQRCDQWVDRVAGLLALVEAGVDFSDQEDVVPIRPDALMNEIDELSAQLGEQLGSAAGERTFEGHPRVVLVGKPNAGKSALFNALLGKKRAVVSDIQGTTRDALRETLDLSHDAPGAGIVELIDLAGLGDAAVDPIDAMAQQLAREVISRADAVLWCDPAGRFEQLSATIPPEAPLVRVRTKSDLPMIGDSGPHDRDGLAVCALDGTAIGVLRRAIADSVDRSGGSGIGAFVPRHRRAIRAAINGIEQARTSIDPGAASIRQPELVALGLRSALDALGELVGEVSPDDVIGRVFASFCVGK